MFEKFTEPARRALFFGRYEASQSGSSKIEVIHLLLGAIREAAAKTQEENKDFFRIMKVVVRKEIVPTGQNTSVDIPLSTEVRHAFEKAYKLASASSGYIGLEQIFTGILEQENSDLARVLSAHEMSLEKIRQKIKGI